ncbi:MAG: pyruvate dehydrogenase (acetyl-transferring), homodimeric type [Egibacteraceae bacterium]
MNGHGSSNVLDRFALQLPDLDEEETREWLDSFDALVDSGGGNRARFLLMKLVERALQRGVGFPAVVSTPYVNTIPSQLELRFPGDEEIEGRISAYVRWNAAVMVCKANSGPDSMGGHLATYASSADLYEVGFNHFFRGKDGGQAGDQIFYQGHAAPGIYARAFLEGRISERQLDRFRTEIGGNGLSSYPHPRLMPGFWEFPTVSMGLGPLCAIYQARFNRYLYNRGLVDTSRSRVWCFLGDGECDEPETLGALCIAAREQLDNLTFVVNCNLQRLDGPVRGNGKILQELEGVFRGAGWNVIKVVWGSGWDGLLANDIDGALLDRVNATVDGAFQRCASESGAYIREHIFGPDPRLRRLVAHLSDDELRTLPWGGHDCRKIYSAYRAATEEEGAPTVILAKTVKGWMLGAAVEARNAAHQIKTMSIGELRALRDRLGLGDQIPDAALNAGQPPYCRPAEGSAEHGYLMERRRALGGSVPKRVIRKRSLALPEQAAFREMLAGSGHRAVSTTMAFARLLRNLMRDKAVGARVVPIVPDEARTFGMDALFSEFGIYAPFEQQYEPVDAKFLLSYKEERDGQILEEGITEAGSLASWTAAGTAYATWSTPMVPFFVFYSMFGFQRVGDLIWAAGDAGARGFLLGATAGRTTLNGEGLQHQDGHSHVLASTVPNLRAYDPAFAYEVAVIIRDGLQRMYTQHEDCFYYLTLYNETMPMPPMPEGAEEGIVTGMYRFATAPERPTRRAVILFSGTGYPAAAQAQRLLAEHHDVAAELWSVTSYKALREEALSAERWNRLHPTQAPRIPLVTESLAASEGPVVAVTDSMKVVPDMVGRWMPRPFIPLGTDGYGRSDTRAALRRHFETDAAHVVTATLHGLAATGDAKAREVDEAIGLYGIDPDLPDPARCEVRA